MPRLNLVELYSNQSSKRRSRKLEERKKKSRKNESLWEKSWARTAKHGWTWAAVAPEHQRQVRDENKNGLQRFARGERKTKQLIALNI